MFCAKILLIYIGIGKEIATYLDAAWKNLITNHFDGLRPDVSQIRALSPALAFQYMENSFVSKGRRDAIPFLPRNNNNENGQSCSYKGSSQLTTKDINKLPTLAKIRKFLKLSFY